MENIEKSKKARKLIRRLVTKTANEVEVELQIEPRNIIDLKAKYEKLSALQEKMQVLDEAILDNMLGDEKKTEEELETESFGTQEYLDKILTMKLKIDQIVYSVEKQNKGTPSESGTSTSTIQKKQFKLPKIELKKFNGKMIDWLNWWSQFEKIHNDEELHATDKFHYLIQSMEPNTRAEEVVRSFPATEDNYPKAIEALKERFGKKKMLIQIYIAELFQMGLQNLNKKTDITTMYDKLVCHVRALESLGITSEQTTLFLYPMIESSLPEETMIAWQRSSIYEKDGSLENPPISKLDYLLQFLRQEVEREEQRSLVRAGFVTTTTKGATMNRDMSSKKESSVPTAADLFNGHVRTSSCIFCEKAHDSKDCANTEFWTPEEMKKTIHEKRACYYCLRKGHDAKQCKSFVRCHLCPKRHFTIMCPVLKEKKIHDKTETTDSSAGTNFDCSTDVLLKTIMVFISVSPNTNKKRAARILFDDGSQKSYITSSMVKSIKSTPFGHEYVRNILFDGSRTECEKLNNHKINISGLDGMESMTMVLREKAILGGNVSRIPKGVWLDELRQKGIIVSDIVRDNKDSVGIDIVIGSDYWGTVMKGNKQTLPCGLTAYDSIFGWTLSGVVPHQSQADNTIAMFLAEENVNKLWSLDIIGIKDPIEKLSQMQEEMAAKKIFKETVKRNAEGRYEVKLPWISEERDIPNNKAIATHRLTSATKKLNTNNRFNTYDDIFKAWIQEGFVEKVDESKENGENCHYLPHHPVFKDSITTPVRPVFDASCKFGRNPSLNDCLYKGPNCIELLPAVLMRFRLKKVGATSDIRKAFQMIDVEKQDREYLRFLWWEEATQTKMITLRHRRVVFGLVCSPYLLAAVLETHLKNVPEPKKKIAEEVLKSIYVDNCVTSFNSHKDYVEFKRIASEILAEAKMELRQWESTFQEHDIQKEEETETKVLGIMWDKKEDNLSIQIPKIEIPEELTKRNIASILHKFFDPIGYTCPALLQPKIMLQQAWKRNISWDSGLSITWKEKFTKWCEEAHLLREIKIPRLCQLPNSSNQQIHTFTDASKDAFATVVFLRTENEGKVEIQLIQSKSRVSPIGAPTIPRLELLGCLIGSRLSTSVIEAMDLKDISTYYWCDSTTAIAWIQRNNEWGTFVGNRVKRILQDTEANQWRHIPGTLNPADLPSRGCSPK